MPKHMMLDLETMGSNNDAAIVEIGAVVFDPFVPGYVIQELSINVSLESSVAFGGVMDPSTVVWWLRQSPDAISRVFPPIDEPKRDGEHRSIGYALNVLRGSYRGTVQAGYERMRDPEPCSALWAHATFDPVVIASAYRRSKITLPWSFRDVRDLRTLTWLAPEAASKAYEGAEEHDGPRHTALADALRQVRVVWVCLEELKGGLQIS